MPSALLTPPPPPAEPSTLSVDPRVLACAQEVKDRFLATMSHELRTPLAVISGVAETLAARPLEPDVARGLRLILDGSQALLGILDEILDFSSSQTGQLVLAREPFSLRAALAALEPLAAAAAHRKGLRFGLRVRGDFSDWLAGDSRRVRQVLFNLLFNAIKFTTAGGVFLSLRGITRAGGVELRATVHDTGPGLDAAARARLFEPFIHADEAAPRQHGGAGLGLAVARALARAMGGDVVVRSRPGRGCAFLAVLRLPAAPAQPLSAYARALPAEPPLPALSILAADDTHTNREVMQMILQALGYNVDLVDDGPPAVEACRARAYDLVLLDLQMPGMDGFEAARLIRERALGAPRIVAVTADLIHGKNDLCAAAGFDALLIKPVGPRELARCIRSLFPAGRAAGAPVAAPRLPLLDEHHLAAFTEGVHTAAQQREILAGLWQNVADDLDRHEPLIRARLAADAPPAEIAPPVHALKGALAVGGWARAAGAAQDLLSLINAGGEPAAARAAWHTLERCLAETRSLAALRLHP